MSGYAHSSISCRVTVMIWISPGIYLLKNNSSEQILELLYSPLGRQEYKVSHRFCSKATYLNSTSAQPLMFYRMSSAETIWEMLPMSSFTLSCSIYTYAPQVERMEKGYTAPDKWCLQACAVWSCPQNRALRAWPAKRHCRLMAEGWPDYRG